MEWTPVTTQLSDSNLSHIWSQVEERLKACDISYRDISLEQVEKHAIMTIGGALAAFNAPGSYKRSAIINTIAAYIYFLKRMGEEPI